MTVTVYKSTDASAPTLNGTAGALVTVLDAVLVNGYGAKAAAGWTKAFSGTNKASYRNSTVTGTGFYLFVDDAAPTTAKEARVTGFQTQSALGVGTGQFPNFASLPLGIGAVIWRKSTTADSTARAWIIVADETVFYLFVDTQDFGGVTTMLSYMFGDFFSYKVSDGYRCAIIGRNVENPGNGTVVLQTEPFAALIGSGAGAGNPNVFYEGIIGHYCAAQWTGVGTSILVGKHIDHTLHGWPAGAAGNGCQGLTQFGSNIFGVATLNYAAMGYNPNGPQTLPYPHGPDQGLILSPVWLHHNGWKRGYFKGIWCPGHTGPLNHGDTYSGTGNLSGKSFLALGLATAAGQTNGSVFGPAQAQIHIETSDTWN